jgi:cytidylate kinase
MQNLGGAREADRRVTEWFLRERARREGREPQAGGARKPQPVVTISRQFGAGGHTVAQKLVEVLGPEWQIWDRQIIDQIAENAQIRRDMVEALDERTQSWMDQFVKNLLGAHVMEPHGYRKHLVQVLLALGQQGHKIIVGRGANFVLRSALNVRLHAPIEFRAEAVMRLEGIGHDEAVKQIHRVDSDRAEFTCSLFGRDIDDPAGYDMVIQTNNIGYDACVAAIAAALRTMFGE